MARKITFEDKVTKNVSTEEDKYKITAKDVNEIKSAVNENAEELTIVSATEPIGDGRKKVWIQRGKNLFKGVISNGDIIGSNSTIRLYTRQEIFIKKGTTVTFSTNLDLSVYNYSVNLLEHAPRNYIGKTSYPIYIYDSGWQTLESALTFTATQDGYIAFGFKKVDNSEITPDNIATCNYQLEQGSEATEYEPYVEKKIFVKNDNGVYEEFVNAEEIETFKNKGTKIACITAKVSETVYLSEASVLTDLKTDTIVMNNSDFKLSDDGGIICPFKGTVLITASAMFSPQKGYCGLSIYKNVGYMFDHYEPSGTPAYGVMEMSNKPLEVDVGDIIYLKARSSSAEDIVQPGDRSRMTVMYIDFA